MIFATQPRIRVNPQVKAGGFRDARLKQQKKLKTLP